MAQYLSAWDEPKKPCFLAKNLNFGVPMPQPGGLSGQVPLNCRQRINDK
jgi:hypothetical protein